MRRSICLAVIAAALAAGATAEEPRTAIFAGGCFWCVESDFDKLDGVIETTSGYTGGSVENPTYKQVTYGDTGHYEAVRVTYDPGTVSYETLLHYFWRTVDPLDAGGQFCDRGDSYRTAVFATDAQQPAAEASKAEAAKALDAEIATQILPARTFYPAEDYHQDYYKKNPVQYKYYRWRCGRDDRIEKLWGDDAFTTGDRSS